MARSTIAKFVGDTDNATLAVDGESCSVLAAIGPVGANDGQRFGVGTFVSQDKEQAIIAAIDADGAPIDVVPDKGGTLTVGSSSYGIAAMKVVAPDGTTAIVYAVELDAA